MANYLVKLNVHTIYSTRISCSRCQCLITSSSSLLVPSFGRLLDMLQMTSFLVSMLLRMWVDTLVPCNMWPIGWKQFSKICYLICSSLPENLFSTSVIRIRLNQNLVALIPTIRDEIIAACSDVLTLKHNDMIKLFCINNLLNKVMIEWRTVLALDISQTLIGRITSWIIIGLPLCESPDFIYYCILTLFVSSEGCDPKWLNIAIWVKTDVAISEAKLDLFPPFIRL